MEWIINHPEIALAGAWYVLSAVANRMPLPKKEDRWIYKATFETLHVITGALDRYNIARKIRKG